MCYIQSPLLISSSLLAQIDPQIAQLLLCKACRFCEDLCIVLQARAGAAAKNAAIKYNLSFLSLVLCRKHLLPPTRALGVSGLN